MDLPVVVTVLPENILQERQLHMQALLIAQSSGPMHQCGKYSLLTGWVVLGRGVKVEVGMGSFTVHSMVQRTVEFSVNVCVKECEVTFTFGLHGELNALVYTVQIVQEFLQLVGSVWLDDEWDPHRPKPGIVGGGAI
jgi:hypothetical protein